MKVVIVIDGDSAADLFAVGPKDLREHFMPKQWGVDPKDVKKIHFEELKRDGKIISTHDALMKKGPYTRINHKDNYERG